MNINNTVLVCPRNDEESLMILKLAEKINLSVVISKQPHGAKLDRESELLARITEANPDVQTVVIVEIPGPKTEKILEEQGLEVIIIDHHRYDELDRMRAQSSLEQFIALFAITDEQLQAWGFEPRMVQAVAAIDRGFVWELERVGISGEQKKRALDFYRKLTLELGDERREREEAQAKIAWSEREDRGGVIIITSEEDRISIRDAISFIVAEQIGRPQTVLIKQGNRRLYVQESAKAMDLYHHFGGFTFGGDRCWGILSEDGNLPSIDEVLAIM